jgi:hypothetical protein
MLFCHLPFMEIDISIMSSVEELIKLEVNKCISLQLDGQLTYIFFCITLVIQLRNDGFY